MQTTPLNNPTPKETRINIRINAEQKAVIALAAQLHHTTISHFVIENAFQAASKLLEEKTQIQMDAQQFKHFCHALDATPAKSLKAMQKLLNSPSILDE